MALKIRTIAAQLLHSSYFEDQPVHRSVFPGLGLPKPSVPLRRRLDLQTLLFIND